MTFEVEGIPRPQTRPRVFKNGGVLKDSPLCKEYKESIAQKFVSLLATAPNHNYEQVMGYGVGSKLSIEIMFLFKGHADKGSWAPDIDNLSKAVLDALNCIAYLDDGQIMRCVAEKRGGCKRNCTIITLKEYLQSPGESLYWKS